MSNAIKPHPATRRHEGINNPMPPAISAKPLITTRVFGEGNPGGMICSYQFGRIKWPIPARMKNVAASQRKIMRLRSGEFHEVILIAKNYIRFLINRMPPPSTGSFS